MTKVIPILTIWDPPRQTEGSLPLDQWTSLSSYGIHSQQDIREAGKVILNMSALPLFHQTENSLPLYDMIRTSVSRIQTIEMSGSRIHTYHIIMYHPLSYDIISRVHCRITHSLSHAIIHESLIVTSDDPQYIHLLCASCLVRLISHVLILSFRLLKIKRLTCLLCLHYSILE